MSHAACAALALGLCFAVVAGCGGSGRAGSDNRGRGKPVAVRVCQSAGVAARSLLGGELRAQVADSDPANVECRLQDAQTRVDVVAQASARAWTLFDTASVHQVQAFGSGAVHNKAQLPLPVALSGASADWIPGQRELIATNGTPSRGGSYVTVKVSGGSSSRSRLRLASAVARATLASAPRGPSPGPPPS